MKKEEVACGLSHKIMCLFLLSPSVSLEGNRSSFEPRWEVGLRRRGTPGWRSLERRPCSAVARRRR